MDPPPVVYAFGELELDATSYNLCRQGRRIQVEPKVIEFVAYLIHQRSRVVRKEELRRALWPGIAVSESSLSRCAWAARKALGDPAQRSRIIKTVYGRGYQFVARVQEARRPSAEELGGRAPGLEPARFVGRHPQMAALQAAAGDAFAGHGALAFLVGEAGIGKTRMAEELATWARARGAVVRFGRCREEPGAPAFFPWLEILRAEARERDREELRSLLGSGAPEIAQLVPELRELLPGLPPPPPIDPSLARFRLFESLTGFWRAAGRKRPLLLVLDDLHRADEPSLRLLRFLGPEVGDLPVLVVGCFREGALDAEPSRARVLAAVMRLPRALRIALPGLSRDEVAECIREIIGSAASERWIASLHEQTGGNPFFLSRLVTLLGAEDLARRRQGEGERIALPRSVRDAIAEQIESLPASTRHVLRVSAVIGREFSLRTLGLAAGRGEAWLRERLGPALDAGILLSLPDQPRRFRFAHALLRDVLYEALPIRRRASWHRRVGEALERSHEGSPHPPLAELAHHFAQAAELGDLDRAIGYATRAGRQAAEQLAYEEAAEHYRRALEFTERGNRVDGHEGLELLLALAEAELRADRVAEATAACRRVAELARRRGAREPLARAALLLAPGFFILNQARPDPETTVELLREAAAALASTRSPLRPLVLARLAMVASPSVGLAEQKTLSQRALAVARSVGDPATLAFAEGAALIGPWDPDDWRERKLRLPEAVRLAELAGEREFSLVLRECWISTLLEDGDVECADREIEIFARQAKELRHPRARGFAANHQSTRALMEGRFEVAERLSREYLERSTRIQDWGGVAAFAMKLVILLWQQGRAGEIAGFVDAFRDLSARQPRLDYWRYGLALGLTAMDRRDEAREVFEGFASRQLVPIRRGWLWIVKLAVLGDVCAYLGDTRRAELLYELLLPHADRFAVTGGTPILFLGSVARSLGVLADMTRRREAARSHFHAALAGEARARAWPCLVRTQHDFARMLAVGGPDDREHAASLAAQALDAARKLGMEGLADSLASLRARLATS